MNRYRLVFIHSDNGLTARIDSRLRSCGHLLDTQFGDPRLNRGSHAAKCFGFGDVTTRLANQLMCQMLDEMTTAKRVNNMRHIGFVLQMDLGVARNTRRIIGWQAQCFV